MHYINMLITFQNIFLKIDWQATWHDIRYFLLGLVTGIILLILSLVGFFSHNERKKAKTRMSHGIPLDDKIVYDMIESKQNQLDKTVKLTDNGYFKVALDLSIELTEEIARYYFPDSRYPIYELSIEELLDLSHYITKRLEDLMNKKGIKLFKRYRIASLIDLLNTKKKISNSKLMQVTRKLKLQTLYTGAKTVLNYANPVYWFRRLAIKPTTVVVTKEVCKYIITIFGEETNKIYSKAIFKEADNEEEIIQKIDQIANEGEE
ncbi:hypothetical protein ACAG96_04805 [Candidatus Izemoplasma sp. B36]|uniref:hypothetical protein n=1 Tax=Candidatus Izemoplasma sp. B36 TaxID=3242468 RepID=UPI0035585165